MKKNIYYVAMERVIASTRGGSSSTVIPAEVLRQAQDHELAEWPESRSFSLLTTLDAPAYQLPGQAYQVRHDGWSPSGTMLVDSDQPVIERPRRTDEVCSVVRNEISSLWGIRMGAYGRL